MPCDVLVSPLTRHRPDHLVGSRLTALWVESAGGRLASEDEHSRFVRFPECDVAGDNVLQLVHADIQLQEWERKGARFKRVDGAPCRRGRRGDGELANAGPNIEDDGVARERTEQPEQIHICRPAAVEAGVRVTRHG